MIKLLIEEYECLKCKLAKNESGYTEDFVIWLLEKQNRIAKLKKTYRRRKDDKTT